jgi:hypothetical protein
MKYAIMMGPSAIIYMPLFIKIGSGIPQFLGGIHIQTLRH